MSEPTRFFQFAGCGYVAPETAFWPYRPTLIRLRRGLVIRNNTSEPYQRVRLPRQLWLRARGWQMATAALLRPILLRYDPPTDGGIDHQDIWLTKAPGKDDILEAISDPGLTLTISWTVVSTGAAQPLYTLSSFRVAQDRRYPVVFEAHIEDSTQVIVLCYETPSRPAALRIRSPL